MNTLYDENTSKMNPIDDEQKSPDEQESPKADISDVSESTPASGTPDKNQMLEFLSRIKKITENRDGNDDIDEMDVDNMDADDFHNKAVELARFEKHKRALAICEIGMKRFPTSVDLLADAIKYSSVTGDMSTASKYYEKLRNIPFQRWNWRAFTFSFDYLLGDPIANEAECRSIIENYKKYLPYEEKANMAESELEAALGNHERCALVLEEAIHTLKCACQCGLKLAKMQLERGDFEGARETCNFGLSSAELQPTIPVPYLLFIRTLAEDSILHKKVHDHTEISQSEIDAIYDTYDSILSDFPELAAHAHTIQMRMKLLKYVKAV